MKPIIVGLNNPYSDDPACALVPYPKRSAGHRLWKMMTDVDISVLSAKAFNDSAHACIYTNAFDRRNLFKGPVPDSLTLRGRAARAMLATFPVGTTVILLGSKVRQAFSIILERPLEHDFIHPQVRDGLTWRCLPHPSGRVTQYNDPVFRMLAGMVLADVLTQHSTGEQQCQEAE